MERFERYDPEDLEHLMLERPFHELLPEEQAYALRHLGDAAEYERMRALLLLVQAGMEDDVPMDAGPTTREHVLRTFREQRRPEWRIWLNSTAAFLFPPRPALYWRPALALGMVVLISLFVFRGNDGPPKTTQLAEVKPAPASPSTASTGAKDLEGARQAISNETPTDGVAAAESRSGAVAPKVGTKEENSPAIDRPKAVGTETAADVVQAEQYVSLEQAEALGEVAMTPDNEHSAKRAGTAARVVQAHVAVAEKANTAQGGYTEDDLLGLLQAAW